jgi:hypothetical protein
LAGLSWVQKGHNWGSSIARATDAGSKTSFMKIVLLTTGVTELSWALTQEIVATPSVELLVFQTKQLIPWGIKEKSQRLYLRYQSKLREVLFHETHPEFFLPISTVPCVYDSDINSNANAERIEQFNPDLIVISGTKRVSKKILAMASLAVNIHHGFLPSYRGVSSIDWVIKENNYNYFVATLHEAVETLDAGKIISAVYVTPYFKEPLALFRRRVFLEGVTLVAALIRSYPSFELIPQGLGFSKRVFVHHDKESDHLREIETEFNSLNLQRYTFWQRYRAYAQRYWDPKSKQTKQAFSKQLVLKNVIRKLRRTELAPGLYILAFHDICEDHVAEMCNSSQVPIIYTSRSNFRAQLDFLANELLCTSLEQGLAMWRSGEAKSRPVVAITIDDGMAGVFSEVEIMAGAKLKPTLFLCGDPIFNSKPLRIHKKYLIRKYLCEQGARVDQLSSHFDEMLTTGFGGANQFESFVRDNYLNVDQIGRLIQSKDVTALGSHTWDHSSLEKDLFETQKTKIVVNHLRLSEHFGASVRYFSYPFGKLDRRSVISEYLAHGVAEDVFECNGGINQNVEIFGGLARIGVGNLGVDGLRRVLSMQWVR